MVDAGLRFASELLSRARVFADGISFGGKRDLYEALGYSRYITAQMYRERYNRGGISGRIVDAFPTATWRGTGEMIENEKPDTITAFEETWAELQERLHLWTMFRRADILSGLGRYSVLMIGAPGNTETPLPKPLDPKNIFYISVYAEDDAKITEYEEDPLNERFGRPLFYTLSRKSAEFRRYTQKPIRVHWSRVIHVSDGLLDDDIHARPRLERCWNDLDNLMKVVGGGSEAFWKTAYPGYQFNVDKEMKIKPDDLAKLKSDVEDFMHGYERAVRTRGVNIETLQANIAQFAENAACVISIISGTTGIPQRLLLGSERGELASSQDRDNWAERVRDRRDDFAGPFVVKQFVNRLIEHGALPTPKVYLIGWGDVYDISQTERIENASKYAEVNQKAGETVITPDEIRDRALDMPPLELVEDDEDIEDVEDVDDEEKKEKKQPKAAMSWQNSIIFKKRQLLIAANGRPMSGKRYLPGKERSALVELQKPSRQIALVK
jgi:hypothetical protein